MSYFIYFYREYIQNGLFSSFHPARPPLARRRCSNNNIGDSGATALAPALSRLTALKHLFVRCVPLSYSPLPFQKKGSLALLPTATKACIVLPFHTSLAPLHFLPPKQHSLAHLPLLSLFPLVSLITSSPIPIHLHLLLLHSSSSLSLSSLLSLYPLPLLRHSKICDTGNIH